MLDGAKKIRAGLACYAQAPPRATHRGRPAAVASLTSTRLPSEHRRRNRNRNFAGKERMLANATHVTVLFG
jgi:hypothetical protein